MPDTDDAPMQDIGDIWADPYPGTGPVAYDTGKPYHSLSEQGLIEGRHGPDTLAEAFRRREAGATLREVRRDLALSGNTEVSDAMLERAIDRAGRGILDQFVTGVVREQPRLFAGIPPLPTRAEYEARQRAQQETGGQ